MKTIKKMDGWLNVSLEGFAQQNAARPIEHLVKELVQNSLDSIEGENGNINLLTRPTSNANSATDPIGNRKTWIICKDNGNGIEDIENIRTIFWTSKQDSHLKRGRMGRGFKELLCLSEEVKVESLNKIAHFKIDDENRHKLEIIEKETSTHKTNDLQRGTTVSMLLGLAREEVSERLKMYFKTLLVPETYTLKIEGTQISPRIPKYTITGTLTTESFENGRWVKPQKKTQIDIHDLLEGETTGLIFEMGIPICPAEWDLPYHVNIQQRVPMNPNRDAVMSGYASKIHKCCLPTLIKELNSEQARATWVGEAAISCQDPLLQKEVLEKAFGSNLARAVPGFGKFDYNADAQESSGAKILDTKQLSGGFRELAKLHIPTSKEVAKRAQETTERAALENMVNLDAIEGKAKEIIDRHGKKTIQKICEFHKFLADEILKRLFPKRNLSCQVRVAMMANVAEATWSNSSSILTLALDLNRIWEKPFDQDNFSLIIHEVAHELAAHHGHSFADALERCAGSCCLSLLENQKEINKFIYEINLLLKCCEKERVNTPV